MREATMHTSHFGCSTVGIALAVVLSITTAVAEQPRSVVVDPGEAPSGGMIVLTESGVAMFNEAGEVLVFARDHVVPAPGYDIWIIDPEFSTKTMKGAICKDMDQCPGGLLISVDGTLTGCWRVPVLRRCAGKCSTCAGSGNKGSFCELVDDPDAECSVAVSVLPKVDCGARTKYPCINGGPGAPAGGCGCQVVPPGAGAGTCMINQCVP
jgi:hypothetical protein